MPKDALTADPPRRGRYRTADRVVHRRLRALRHYALSGIWRRTAFGAVRHFAFFGTAQFGSALFGVSVLFVDYDQPSRRTPESVGVLDAHRSA